MNVIIGIQIITIIIFIEKIFEICNQFKLKLFEFLFVKKKQKNETDM